MAGCQRYRESLNVKPPRITLPRAGACLLATLEMSNGILKPSNRGAKIIGAAVEHFVDELRDGAELHPIVAREALDQAPPTRLQSVAAGS